MSNLDQRQKALQEGTAGASAINDSSSPAGPDDWKEISRNLLQHSSTAACRPAVPAFPLALLPHPWRAWACDAAQSSAAPVDYVVQAMLAAVTGMGGRRVFVIPRPGWQEPLRLWLAAIGGPSTGKSPALTSVRRLLAGLENELATTGEGTGSRWQISLSDNRFERIAARLTKDPRGLVLWRDGPSGCLAPLGNRHSVQQLEPSAPSIVGSINPERVDKRLRPDDVAARFLYAWPLALPFRPLGERTALPSDAVLAPLRRIARLFGPLQRPHGLFMTEPATRAFDAFRARLHDETFQAEGLDAAWHGKGGGAVACLAGTFELMSWSAASIDGLPECVDLESVERAIALWSDYYRPHARAFFKRSGPTDPERQVRRVLRWLASDGRPMLSLKDVRRTALGETVNAREADDVIEHLVEAGVLRRLPPETGQKGGRPIQRWQVHPSLVRSSVAETAETAQT
jgi:hypothetical protein